MEESKNDNKLTISAKIAYGSIAFFVSLIAAQGTILVFLGLLVLIGKIKFLPDYVIDITSGLIFVGGVIMAFLAFVYTFRRLYNHLAENDAPRQKAA